MPEITPVFRDEIQIDPGKCVEWLYRQLAACRELGDYMGFSVALDEILFLNLRIETLQEKMRLLIEPPDASPDASPVSPRTQRHFANIAYSNGGYRLLGYWWQGGPCNGEYQAYQKPSAILGKTPEAVLRRLADSHLTWAVPVAITQFGACPFFPIGPPGYRG